MLHAAGILLCFHFLSAVSAWALLKTPSRSLQRLESKLTLAMIEAARPLLGWEVDEARNSEPILNLSARDSVEDLLSADNSDDVKSNIYYLFFGPAMTYFHTTEICALI